MRPLLNLCALVATCLLGWTSVVSAETTTRPLPVGRFELHGTEATATEIVSFDPPADRTVAELTLKWIASDMVDPGRSTLTVEVDGAPLSTARLSTAAREHGVSTLRVPLLGVGAGFHPVKLRTHLVVDDELCAARHARDAWLRLLPTSTISWEHAAKRATQDSGKQAEAESIVSRLERLGERSDAPILVDLPPDTEGAAAAFEAHALVRSLGGRPHLVPKVGTVTPALILRRAEIAAALAPVRVTLEGPSVVVVGASASALLRAVVVLRDKPTRSLCLGTTCWLGPFLPQNAVEQPAASTPLVWSLREQDKSGMWTARGEGDHTLRFTWRRPAGTTVKGWPELHLPVVTSSFDAAAEPSRATLSVNGLPLNSWTFGRGPAPERIGVRIPKELWDSEAWEFELHVQLHISDTTRCQVDDSGAPWITLGGGGLYVPRREEPVASVASFAQAIAGSPMRLHVGPELGWPELARVADALAPLRDAARGWEPVNVFEECAARCVLARGSAAVAADATMPFATVVGADGALFWADRTGRGILPATEAANTLLLLHSPTPGAGKLIAVVPPGSSRISAPDFAQLRTAAAFQAQTTWTGLAVAYGTPAPNVAIDIVGTPPVEITKQLLTPTDEEGRLARIDKAAMLVALGCVTLGILWIVFSVRHRARKGATE